MRYTLLKATAAALLLLGSMAGAQAATVTSLTPIANVPGTGANGTGVLGINDSGIVAGGWYDTNSVEHGFFGPPDGSNYTSFDDGTLGTEARAINNKNLITGYFLSSTLSCSILECEFERTAAGKISTITMSGTPLTGIPGGIVASGQFVGDYRPAGGGHHAYYGANHVYNSDITLPFAVAATHGRGLSVSGEVVGFFTSADGTKTSGFVIQNGTVTVVNDPHPNAVNGTYLEGVNKNGYITGQWDDKTGLPHAFILTPDFSTFYEIAVPNSTYTQAFGINASNRVVVVSDPGSFIYCDSRTHASPKCTPPPAAFAPASEPIRVPSGTFAQYKCHGDCITYKLVTPGAKTAPAGTVAIRAFQLRRPGIYLP
jgi:hypothetical protein